MPMVKRRSGWEIPEHEVTPEQVYLNRRAFLKQMGLGALSLATVAACGSQVTQPTLPALTPTPPAGPTPTPAPPNARYVLDRPITDEKLATTFNNFYEFSVSKSSVWETVTRFQTRPWEIEIAGLVPQPRVYDLDDLRRLMAFEERLYRFRCVETWAMANPWTGFPLESTDRQSPAPIHGQVREVHDVPSPRPGAWSTRSHLSLAVQRRPIHGRGDQRTGLSGNGHVWARSSPAEWRPDSPGCAMEIRLQECQVDSPD